MILFVLVKWTYDRNDCALIFIETLLIIWSSYNYFRATTVGISGIFYVVCDVRTGPHLIYDQRIIIFIHLPSVITSWSCATCLQQLHLTWLICKSSCTSWLYVIYMSRINNHDTLDLPEKALPRTSYTAIRGSSTIFWTKCKYT